MVITMITARPIATRYDTRENSQLTVATPSCCCCCCCCLGTIAGVVTFSAKHVSNERKNHGGNAFAPVLAVFALPVAVGAMVLAARWLDGDGRLILAAGGLAFLVTYLAGLWLAGNTNLGRSIVTPVLLIVVGAVAMVGEVFLVLYSLGFAWLILVPGAIWVGAQIAGSMTPSAPPGPPRPYRYLPSSPNHFQNHPTQGDTATSATDGPAPMPPVAPPTVPRNVTPPDLDFWQSPSRQDDDVPPTDPPS